jgi:hypothetical protein
MGRFGRIGRIGLLEIAIGQDGVAVSGDHQPHDKGGKS